MVKVLGVGVAVWFALVIDPVEGWAQSSAPCTDRPAHAAGITSIAISPDGHWLASGSDDKKVKLWDLRSGELANTFVGHSERVQELAFIPDGKTLASISWDETLRTWDIRSGTALSVMGRPTGRYAAKLEVMAVSPDGRQIATGSEEHAIRLWDIAWGRDVALLKTDKDIVSVLKFGPQGKFLLSQSYGAKDVEVWTGPDRQMRTGLGTHKKEIASVALSPRGDVVATGSWDRTIEIRNTASGALKKKLDGLGETVRHLAYSPDGLLLVAIEDGGVVRGWDVATWKTRFQTKVGGRNSFGLILSPDSKWLAVAVDGELIHLVDLPSGAERAALGPKNWTHLAVSPDSTLLASVTYDVTTEQGGIKLWNSGTGKLATCLVDPAVARGQVAGAPR